MFYPSYASYVLKMCIVEEINVCRLVSAKALPRKVNFRSLLSVMEPFCILGISTLFLSFSVVTGAKLSLGYLASTINSPLDILMLLTHPFRTWFVIAKRFVVVAYI